MFIVSVVGNFHFSEFLCLCYFKTTTKFCGEHFCIFLFLFLQSAQNLLLLFHFKINNQPMIFKRILQISKKIIGHPMGRGMVSYSITFPSGCFIQEYYKKRNLSKYFQLFTSSRVHIEPYSQTASIGRNASDIPAMGHLSALQCYTVG